MNESRRKAYLNAMGIDVYYPRVNLPGTKISPLYEFDLEEALELPAAAGNPTIDAQESRTATEPNIIRDAVKGARVESKEQSRAINENDAFSEIAPAGKVAKTEATSEPKQTATTALRFVLRYYKITDALAVIEEYPLQQSQDSNNEALNLLRNILHALTIQPEGSAFVPEHFNWPLLEGLSATADEATVARQALVGFIAGRQQQDGFKNLLVFAGFIDDLLIGPDDAGNRRDYMIPGTDYSITLTHSLQSMLSYPRLKRDVWQQLQPLLSRIQAEN